MKPQRLKKGDVIGVVSPGRWMLEEDLYSAVSIIEKMGFFVKLHPQNFLKNNQYAGTDTQRITAIHEIFEDPKVQAVMCAKGGYGALRIVDKLNYNLISKNHKIFIGYSDATAILNSIFKTTRLITFHGPMLYSFRNEEDAFTVTYFEKALCETTPYIIKLTETMLVRILRSGKARGQILGGNLSMLVNLIGTPQDFDTSGKILFIEDVDEYYYSLDRMMVHLKRSGKLDNLEGLIVGNMIDIKDNKIPFGSDIDDIILDACKGSHFPIVTNFPCGHGRNQLTIPISVMAELDCSTNNVILHFLESGVQ